VIEVSVREWAETETQSTELDYQITEWRTPDTIPNASHHEIGPPDGDQWIVADIWVRNLGDDGATVGYSQWHIENFAGVEFDPHQQMMDNANRFGEAHPPLPQETRVPPNDGRKYRVIWAMEETNDITFVIEPYGDSEGPTIRVET
jgi:hypothetical protein